MSSVATLSSSQAPEAPSLDKPTESNTLFFLCDVQETFRGKVLNFEQLVAGSKYLLTLASKLQIPVITTEQRPFKPTVAELQPLISAETNPLARLYTKSLFSMVTPEVSAHLSSLPARRHVVLFGLEAHVCVLQTALDLLRGGYVVHLVVDCVGSQNGTDRGVALDRLKSEAARMQPNGAALVLTTAESVVYEILGDAAHPQFKPMVPAIKEFAAVKKGGAAPSVSQAAKL